MYDLAIAWDWVAFAVRWVHVITAIAWIGSSFYFIALDLGLRRAPGMPDGVTGEEWQVHGGGFYHIRKYAVAPDAMPDHLTWFKWEAYSTWLSGAALLMVLYWAGAELYMIDPAKADLAPWQAAVISAAFIAAGWIGYDALCRAPLRPPVIMAILFAGICVSSWALSQVFTGRAALLHLGAMTATIMTANVFLVIMPNQRIVVADLKAGRAPDPEYGRIAKLRSTHNNYLTLPVVFLMLSNHYPLAFATPHAWIIAILVFPIGALVRHWFNTRHAGGRPPAWTWGAAAVLFILIAWLSSAPMRADAQGREDAGFEAAWTAVSTRCTMCHATEPVWPGLHWPPMGVVLETPSQLRAQAKRVYLQSGASHAMPPANLTAMTPRERAAIRDWFETR